MPSFVWQSHIAASPAQVYAWHERPGDFERLNPPWDPVKILARTGCGIENGARVTLALAPGGVPVRWVLEHRDFVRGSVFCDVQVSGPFKRWEHTHLFEPDQHAGCLLTDRIEYDLPGGALGRAIGQALLPSRLERLFRYRHRITAQDVVLHRSYALEPLRILLTGASGFIGSQLGAFLSAGGHTVTGVVRSARAKTLPFETVRADLEGDIQALPRESFDAVIHLAGENIAAGRWTAEKKRRIRDSRVVGTANLCRFIRGLAQPPKAVILASAIGLYGHRPGEILDENTQPGEGFLAEIGQEWEAASAELAGSGIRVATLRIGMVLNPAGGALGRMLRPFLLGLGGPLGSGRQVMSWLSLDELFSIVLFVLANNSAHGPLNAVSPNPLTNREFTQCLARILGRPAFLKVPGWALKAIFGEMAEHLLLASAEAVPKRLMDLRYQFLHPTIKEALKFSLGLD